MTHIQLKADEPMMHRLDSRLASFCRLILVDERGSGMSDPIPLSEVPTLEQRADDLLAVLEHSGLEWVVPSRSVD